MEKKEVFVKELSHIDRIKRIYNCLYCGEYMTRNFTKGFEVDNRPVPREFLLYDPNTGNEKICYVCSRCETIIKIFAGEVLDKQKNVKNKGK